MTRRDSLLNQVVAANVLLVTATLFAASLAADLDLTASGGRREFLILAFAIVLTLLVNVRMLRRRFQPLEQLIADVEAIDPAAPGAFSAPANGRLEEIDRLVASFKRLLERIEAERTRSGRLVIRAQEEERKRLARDLHDEVNQALTALLLRLEAVSQDAPPGLGRELAETKLLANQAMEQLLQLARQLRPSALDDHGLATVLRAQLRRFRDQTGIAAELTMRGDLRALDEEHRTAVYRIVQEALTNVRRHAEAAHVDVRIEVDGSGVRLAVADDGVGIAADGPPGLGLEGMAERARLAGGELRVGSRRGEGTRLEAVIP